MKVLYTKIRACIYYLMICNYGCSFLLLFRQLWHSTLNIMKKLLLYTCNTHFQGIILILHFAILHAILAILTFLFLFLLGILYIQKINWNDLLIKLSYNIFIRIWWCYEKGMSRSKLYGGKIGFKICAEPFVRICFFWSNKQGTYSQDLDNVNNIIVQCTNHCRMWW